LQTGNYWLPSGGDNKIKIVKKIAIILFILIIATIGGYFYFRSSNATATNSEQGIVQNIANFFPNAGTRTINVVNSFFGGSTTSSSEVAPGNQLPGTDLTAKFQSISNGPISGATQVTIVTTKTKTVKNKTVIISENSSSTIWYMDKTSGYIYSYDPATGEQTQTSNTTKPGVSEISWGLPGGSPRFILRSAKDQKTENLLSQVSKNGSSTMGELSSMFLSANISSLAVSPNRSQYFYLVSSSNGSIGYVGDLSGKQKDVQVFSSPYPDWKITWPETNIILFQSAPSSDFTGLVYAFNLKTKAFTKILGGIGGLTALMSPDGKKIIYAGTDLDLRLKILGTTGTDISLDLATLPEKCVWTKDSKAVYCSVPNSLSGETEPDAWYQGLSSFDDSFWRVNAITGAKEQLFNPSKSGGKTKIDGIDLFLSNKEDKLFITDKQSGVLWMLSLAQTFSTSVPDQTTKATTSTSTP